jgi:hypothetical protein
MLAQHHRQNDVGHWPYARRRAMAGQGWMALFTVWEASTEALVFRLQEQEERNVQGRLKLARRGRVRIQAIKYFPHWPFVDTVDHIAWVMWHRSPLPAVPQRNGEERIFEKKRFTYWLADWLAGWKQPQ